MRDAEKSSKNNPEYDVGSKEETNPANSQKSPHECMYPSFPEVDRHLRTERKSNL